MENKNIENEYKYLDLLAEINRKLDIHQKEACCRTDNTVVAAGAGSGKTQVLATRFAWLVMSKGIPASKILTITFTKKATGEMYERIYKTLSFFAEHAQTPSAEKERARQALADFSNVHIQTFDSYCKGIVEQASTEYGIRPDFSLGEGDSESDIKKQALPFVFEKRESQGIKTFAGAGKYQDFADKLLAKTIIDNTSIITPENFFLQKLDNQKKEIIKAWNFLLLGETAQTNPCPDSLKDAYNEYLSDNTAAGNLKNAVDIFKKEFETAQENHADGKADFENSKKAKQTFSSLCINDFILAPDFDFENPSEKELSKIKTLISAISLFSFTFSPGGVPKDVKALRAALKPLRTDGFFPKYLNSISSYITNYAAIKSLNQLFDSFTALINRQKRLSGKLTFKDVSELSLEILKKHKDIRKQEKEAFSKIMIDEFQDNNGKNRDLLFLISEKDFESEEYGCKDYKNGSPTADDIVSDKLFFVGDEKQSIYKFRGADVSVFNALKNDLGSQNFLQMIYNYRSDNELITGFNRIFGSASKIFKPDTNESFEAKYESKAIKYDPAQGIELTEAKLKLNNTRIHFCALNTKLAENDADKEYLDNNNQTAYFIAKKIAEMKLIPDEKGRIPSYSDFAILDKSRKRKQLLIWLNYFGIPYQLDQNTDIFTDGPINDIYSFLRLCVYPGDKNAFAAFLASPFCNLNQKALQTVLAESTLSDLPNTREELEKRAAEMLSEVSQAQQERFVKGILYIKEKSHQVLSQKLSTTINDLWYESGYHYATMENQKTELYAELFDFLFELARQCDDNQKNISWFVDQLGIVKNKENFSQDEEEIDVKEISYPLEEKDAVQIMTIHKSKGLQFKYVFVTGCIGAAKKGDKAQVFFDDEFGASIRPESDSSNYFALIQKALSDKKELAEFRRLIYVAITRAISEVYIVGAWNPNSDSFKKESDEENLKLIEKTALAFYSDELTDNGFALDQEQYSQIEPCPFTYQGINPVKKAETYRSATQSACKTRIFDQLPADTEVISLAPPPSLRKTPSHQDEKDTEEIPLSGSRSPSEQESGLTGAEFGTLVHDYLRAQAEGIRPEEYKAPVKLFKQLSEKKIAQNKELCIKMCHEFAENPLGKAAYSSPDSASAAGRLLKAEWAFRMFFEGFIWTGSIDLIFENADGTYTIVDYKSDSEMQPEIHQAQLKVYRTAAAKLLKISEEKITTRLWYVRFNKMV